MTLAGAQRGDMRAFEQIYRCYGQACYQLAFRFLGHRAQSEDMVQEIFLKMMQTIRGYRGDAPFGAWFKRLSVNACIDHLRRQRHGSEDIEAVISRTADCGVEPTSRLDASSLLARLTPRARAIVILHELEGYTHSELAGLFGQSESYSKSILSRSLKHLHRLARKGQLGS